MRPKTRVAHVLLMTLSVAVTTRAETYLEPAPYLGFQDSPFGETSFQYFYLEDFENGELSVPGVLVTGDTRFQTPSSLTDSVDEDDGVVDGLGRAGYSLFSRGSVSFDFDEQELGALPTHVGIVWTDGALTTSFEAFDAAGQSLGVLGPYLLGDGSFYGTTAEDRFLGIVHEGGISGIVVHNPAGIEVDHLQYGMVLPEAAMLQVALDIQPGACPNHLNARSKGNLPVALLGSGHFDVYTIDLTSLQLFRADGVGGSVAPLEGPPGPHSVIEDVGLPVEGEPCACHDPTGDGVADLAMMFSVPEVVASLGLDGLQEGESVELVVSGSLQDGSAFDARDCVVVKGK